MIRLSTIAIAVVVLVSFFDNFSQFPIIAPYARSLGADPGAIGLVVAIYSATNLAGNLLAGYYLDRVGRKRLLVIGLVAAAGAVLLYGAVRSPGELAAVRALHGLAAAILAPAAFTLLGDLFPKERRGRAMGANGALIALAAMLAPPISGAVRDRFGFDAVFFLVAGLLLSSALLARSMVRDSYQPPAGQPPPAGSLVSILRPRPLLIAYGAAAALSYGLGTLVTYLPLHLEDQGYRAAHTGLAFSSFAVVALIVMASPASRSRTGMGRVGPIAWGLGAVGLGLMMLAGATTLEPMLVWMGLYGLGFGLIFPAANSLVADSSLPSQRGTAFGVFYAFYSAGVVAGASMAGLAAGLEWGTLGGPLLLAGLLTLTAGASLLVAGRQSRVPAA